MGIDVKSYVQGKNLSPVDNIKNQVNKTASGLTSQLTGQLAGALYEAGGSAMGSVKSVLASKLDSVVGSLSSGAGSILGAVGDGFERIAPDKLISQRMGQNISSIMPETKTAGVIASTAGGKMLTYPPDLGKYFMKFELGKYSRPNVFNSSNEDPFSAEITISLPMPANLVDAHDVNLNVTDMKSAFGGSAAAAYAAEKTAQGIQRIQNGTGPTGNISGELMGNVAAVSGLAAADIATVAAEKLGLGGFMGVTGQLLGAIPNPHMTVFFEGVGLRKHSFSWRFAPRNADESMLIKGILKEFKSRSRPNRAWGTAAALGYPDMVRIELVPNSDELYTFKTCLIESVHTDYAPQGFPSFFAGTRAPTMIEFRMSLQEIEYFVREDFDAATAGQGGDAGMQKAFGDLFKVNE